MKVQEVMIVKCSLVFLISKGLRDPIKNKLIIEISRKKLFLRIQVPEIFKSELKKKKIILTEKWRNKDRNEKEMALKALKVAGWTMTNGNHKVSQWVEATQCLILNLGIKIKM
jgi:hypothetical protein